MRLAVDENGTERVVIAARGLRSIHPIREPLAIGLDSVVESAIQRNLGRTFNYGIAAASHN